MKSLLYILLLGAVLSAQTVTDTLSIEETVALALQNNYDIQLAKRDYDQADNNATAANAQLLPSLVGAGGINYVHSDGSLTGLGPTTPTTQTSLGLEARYTIFNGMYNINTFKTLKGQKRLSAAQTQARIEGTIIQVIYAYLNLSASAENVLVKKEAFDISRERFERAKAGEEYANTGKLERLRAEVDFMSDSTQMIVAQHDYEKALNTFNGLLVRELTTPTVVDTALTFDATYDKGVILEKTLSESSTLRAAREAEAIADLNVSLHRTAFAPRIDLSAGIDMVQQEDYFRVSLDNPIKSARAGLSATWYLYDGRAFSAYKNSKINREKASIEKEKEEQSLMQEVANRYNAYVSSLEVLQAEKKSMAVSELTFQRTYELAKLGQITSTEFREVQLNMLQAKVRYIQAKNVAKLAEFELVRLQGDLVAPVEGDE